MCMVLPEYPGVPGIPGIPADARFTVANNYDSLQQQFAQGGPT